MRLLDCKSNCFENFREQSKSSFSIKKTTQMNYLLFEFDFLFHIFNIFWRFFLCEVIAVNGPANYHFILFNLLFSMPPLESSLRWSFYVAH